MNTPETSNQASGNDPVRAALSEWKVSAPLPPQFHARVWGRIARAATDQPPSLWRIALAWLAGGQVRPAWACAYLIVLLMAGGAGGYWHSAKDLAQESQTSRERYVQSVDPYQKPHD